MRDAHEMAQAETRDDDDGHHTGAARYVRANG
jgi:hypothetical protein